VSQKALVAYEKDVANIILAEERRARNVLRFFGGRLIEKVARILQKNRHGVMLQKELDALFEPKLSEFHRLHKIVDRIYPTT
jgi:hypothetical protein